MLSCLIQDLFLDIEDQTLAVAGEKLDHILCGLVGAQKTIKFIITAAVNRGSHDLIEAADSLRACRQEDPLCPFAGMDVAVEHMIRIGEDGSRLIGKDDLAFGSAGLDQVSVILNIIHTGELMCVDAEELSVFFQSKHIAIGIDACSIDLVKADQFVSDFIGRIAEHQDDLLCALRDAPQTDREPVAGKNGEDHSHSPAAELGSDICRDILHAAVITL